MPDVWLALAAIWNPIMIFLLFLVNVNECSTQKQLWILFYWKWTFLLRDSPSNKAELCSGCGLHSFPQQILNGGIVAPTLLEIRRWIDYWIGIIPLIPRVSWRTLKNKMGWLRLPREGGFQVVFCQERCWTCLCNALFFRHI